MSRSVRRAHLWWWWVVGPGAIVVLAIALAKRPARPVETYTPPETRAPP